jgi:hypothetical protein
MAKTKSAIINKEKYLGTVTAQNIHNSLGFCGNVLRYVARPSVESG